MRIRKLVKNRRSRLAASEIVGAVILIGVTLSVGLAAWAWASGAARNAESHLNGSISENFTIVNANFSSSGSAKKLVTVAIYNPQAGSEYIQSIVLGNFSATTVWTYSNSTLAQTSGPYCKKCVALTGQTITLVTVNVATNLTPGSLYTFKVTGQYGTTYQYQQVR
jgi:hypothetical protein